MNDIAKKEEYLYLKSLISQGEHQHLDFKFSVSDSRKIARSLVAFANTAGGSLLIGVKDNGKISGISSDEEIYMVDLAASLHCKPQVKYSLRLWQPDEKKQVLEVTVKQDTSKLWKAHTDDNRWKIWLRYNAHNIIADNIWEIVWKKKRSKTRHSIIFNVHKFNLLNRLNLNRRYTTDEITELSGYNKKNVESIISDLVVLGLMDIDMTDTGIAFTVIDRNL